MHATAASSTRARVLSLRASWLREGARFSPAVIIVIM
jgi:hypothetical protein